MSTAATIDRIDQSEALVRRDLAAAYRLIAHFGWEDLVATHISARLPDNSGFLLNPFGLLFDEITPADLIKVGWDGNLLAPSNWRINPAGFAIHSAVLAGRPDVQCAAHLHTNDGIAVSMLEEGLLPLNQTAMLIGNNIAYHEYEGIAALNEREQLQADLGDKNFMLLRNHGTLAVGGSVAEAFIGLYYLETSCSIQVRAFGMGRPIRPVSQEVVDDFAKRAGNTMATLSNEMMWPALLRKLDRIDAGWRG